MASRLDQRLAQAGLLKPVSSAAPVNPPSSQPSSSCSSSDNILEEPGYAKLAVLPAHTPGPRLGLADSSQKNNGSTPEPVFEEDYANPADALKMTRRNKGGPAGKLSPFPVSPPVSPQLPDKVSRLSPETVGQVSPKISPKKLDPYQSVDDVRMMREKQLKVKGSGDVQLREKDQWKRNTGGSKADVRVSRDLDHICDDDTSGYSRPFDALAAHRKRLPTAPEVSSSLHSLNTASVQFGQGQRSSSAEKLHGNEPSARFLHQVSSSGESQDPEPEGKRQRTRSVGGKNQIVEKKNQKENNQTGVLTEDSSAVNRYILKIEDKKEESSRGATGRTCSVGSLKAQTPVKITKLRNGKGRVAILGRKKETDNN